MTLVSAEQTQSDSTPWTDAVLVVGAGVSGFRFVEELRSLDATTPILLFGDEPYLPYDRVKLSAYLAGVQEPEGLALPLSKFDNDPLFQYIHANITTIDRKSRKISDDNNVSYSYYKLILATGSRPHIPGIEGIDKTGVFTFRNMRDTEHLKARTVRSHHLVILGGGLLGIEAARALRQNNTKVTIIEVASHVMNRQLDKRAAQLLQTELEAQNFDIITSQGIAKISGDPWVESITLRDGKIIKCDTVLISTGIRPNMEIARSAWMRVGRGIRVNDQLQTSDPNIYAIGECAEHRDKIYGLAAPGLEQAAIAAHHIHGEDTRYLGSYNVARLKLVNIPVFSIGDIDLEINPELKTVTFDEKGVYRNLFLRKGKIVGAVVIGEWAETPRVQELVTHQRRINLFKQSKFKRTGFLYSTEESSNPNLWPEGAIICNCNNVSRGTLSKEIEKGCLNINALTQKTRAGSTCGSCKPLLQEMLGDSAPASPENGWKTLLTSAVMTIFLTCLLFLTPGFNVSDTVQGGFKFESVWNDGLIKQITGFSLLGLTVIGLFMSARKRIEKVRFGSFEFWRIFHIFLAITALLLIVAHTGMHSGSNLNYLLLINYLSISILGAIAATTIAMQFSLSTQLGQKLRSLGFWSHLLLAWPLPALLGFHILSVYYF